MDILRMLEQLQEMAVERPRSFMGLTWGLNKDDISMQISKVRASLPNELKAAVQISRESERIVDTARVDATVTLDNAGKEAERTLAEARREAELIVEQARLQQERMVSESELLKLAKAQSEEIRNSAERDSREIRRGAENYAYQMLAQLETVIGKVAGVIDQGKQEIDRTPEVAIIQTREKVKP
jgi:cell division septum initiation protein DivIVA